MHFHGCNGLTSITIDSATVANGCTNIDAMGELLHYAQTIYIKDNITTIGGYITENFTKQPTSDKLGYNQYTKNT